MNWTQKERRFMEENCERLTQKQMAKALGRGVSTINRLTELFGLQKAKVKREAAAREPRYTTLQWQKGKHLQSIWNDIHSAKVHMGQGS